jgi:glycosyltransferase involved in cell wall biosynthesis
VKILLITSFFPPNHTAGTEKRTYGYARMLSKKGYQVQVLCAEDFDRGNKYFNGIVDDQYQGISVRRVNLNWTLARDPNRYLYQNSCVKQQLSSWLHEFRPDLVHITSCVSLSASVIEEVRRQRIPILLTLTDFWFICPRISLLRYDHSLCDGRTSSWDCLKCKLWDNRAFRKVSQSLPEEIIKPIFCLISQHYLLNRWRGFRGLALNMGERKNYLKSMINKVDLITAPSENLKKIIENSGITENIQVVNSGHDVVHLSNIQKKSSDFIRFAYIGQIIPQKGIHTLLQAYTASPWSGPAQLKIYGDQQKDLDYKYQLEQIVGGENNRSILFKGIFPPERLGDVFSEIDVLVVPSEWHENNPRVIQEAFACKTPVIASDVGGISEFVIHGFNGLLFKRGDAQDLRLQMNRFTEEPGLLVSLSSSINRVKTMEEEVDQLLGLYESLCNQFLRSR